MQNEVDLFKKIVIAHRILRQRRWRRLWISVALVAAAPARSILQIHFIIAYSFLDRLRSIDIYIHN